MKRSLISVFLCMLVGVATAQVLPFVKVGGALNDYCGENSGGIDSKVGYQVGVGLEIPFSNSAYFFQPALMYFQKGAKMDNNTGTNFDFTQNYFELPVNVGYKYDFNEKWGVKFLCGVYFAYGISGNTEVHSHSGEGSLSTFGNAIGYRKFDFGLTYEAQLRFSDRFFIGLGSETGFIPLHASIEGLTYPRNLSYTLNFGFYLK